MANGINNKYEYRSGLLDSLNVQHTASDVRNEDEYRKKVLNGLGVEYTEDDINQKNLYRAKVVEGLASSGGGGESDFSIATVTTINNTSFDLINFNIPIVCEENELGEGLPAMIHNEMVIRSGEETHKVCMYKRLAFCEEAFPSLDYVITVSGDIVYEEGNLIITGDCTITISKRLN